MGNGFVPRSLKLLLWSKHLKHIDGMKELFLLFWLKSEKLENQLTRIVWKGSAFISTVFVLFPLVARLFRLIQRYKDIGKRL